MDASRRHAKLQELYDLAQGSEEFEGGDLRFPEFGLRTEVVDELGSSLVDPVAERRIGNTGHGWSAPSFTELRREAQDIVREHISQASA